MWFLLKILAFQFLVFLLRQVFLIREDIKKSNLVTIALVQWKHSSSICILHKLGAKDLLLIIIDI